MSDRVTWYHALWDAYSEAHMKSLTLPHYWFVGGQCRPFNHKDDPWRPQYIPDRCSIVQQHLCRNEKYVAKHIVETNDHTEFVLLTVLCRFDCVEGFMLNPLFICRLASNSYDVIHCSATSY